jgi:hypothetical protein
MAARRVNKFLADYTVVPHLRNPPKTVAAATQLRDARRAAVLAHAGEQYADTEEGRDRCSFCHGRGYGASRCRVRGEGCSGHGPARDALGQGGPDFDFEHFPVGCHVRCTAPPFEGRVTQFDRRSGQHTVALDAGGERHEFLGYLAHKCTVTGARSSPAAARRCRV